MKNTQFKVKCTRCEHCNQFKVKANQKAMLMFQTPKFVSQFDHLLQKQHQIVRKEQPRISDMPSRRPPHYMHQEPPKIARKLYHSNANTAFISTPHELPTTRMLQT